MSSMLSGTLLYGIAQLQKTDSDGSDREENAVEAAQHLGQCLQPTPRHTG